MKDPKAHSNFHRNAADSARLTARELYAAAAFNRQDERYRQGQTFDRLADQHDLAAGGTLMFNDCPDCPDQHS